MEDLQGIKTEVLIDMLAKQTSQLTSRIAEQNNAVLQQYEYEIALIQAELNARKQKEAGNGNSLEHSHFDIH